MTALASTDVTVAIPAGQRDLVPAGPKLMSLAAVTFGDGAKTYPAGGVPLPDKSQFGFRRAIQFCAVQQPAADGFVYKYDADNHTLKIFTQGAVTGSTAATTCGNGALAEDSAGAETTVRLSGTSADTTYDLGAMIELPATVAPAAVSVTLLLVGE